MADQQGPQRPASIRSVASNSSIASGVSLTRRSRTRTRSKTLTGGSSRFDSGPKSPASELPYLGAKFTEEPMPDFPPTSLDFSDAPPRPPRSPRRNTHELGRGPVGDDANVGSSQGGTSNPPIPMTEESLTHHHHSPAKFTSQTSGMQILPTAAQPEPPPSAFSRAPELTGFDPSSANVRDSVSTQLSTLSSSVYPPSTSTTSGPDSPSSPRSMIQQTDDYGVTSYDPEVGETQEYDGDDVSYRLRLLVNNNYFLPPAHSKPSAADFAALEKTIQKKPSTPTFFDRLRGRSKSKPTTPTGLSPGFDPAGPALRTAADSITTAHLLRPQPPRTSSQFPRGPPPETRTGRVVVVREKMQDLAVAAKQAEQDMKARGFRRDQDLQAVHKSTTAVIDPTDAVDLPPPSSTYPFAVQASALHGLGVKDSVGAALLADRLPPPQSPGMSSIDPEEHWRKALLHQAVHHSLDSTPDTSFSAIQATSTPVASPLVGPSRGPETTSVALLEQRIITNPRFSNTSSPAVSRKKSNQSVTSASSRSKRPNRPSIETSGFPNAAPLRSTTPSGPLTPLTPAPRRHVINLSHSTSHSEFEHHVRPVSVEGPSRAALRRTMSSPILSDAYESDARNIAMTPPPLPTPTLSTTSFIEMQDQSRVTSQSFYTEHELEIFNDGGPRRSFAMSAIEGRPSLSEYSQPSPTMSAFRDAPRMEDDTIHQGQWRPNVDHGPSSARESPIPRYSAMSPPPRISSSMAHFALSPPPRSSPFDHQIRSTPSPRASEGGRTPQPSTPLIDDPSLMLNDPEPTIPHFPLSQRRRNSNGKQLSLEIPSTNIPVAIHSAPGPSSPTAFFDTIQSQPNAMDDLESSSDESDDDDVPQLSPASPNISDPRSRSMSITPVSSRPPLMRLGNHSTPYMSQAIGERPRPSISMKDKKPISHVPERALFFREVAGKSDQGHGPPVSSFDFYKYAQRSSVTTELISSGVTASKRRSTVGNVPAWRTMNPKAQESLRKLDGLLIQHMEAEKDTIKRIATSARSNIPVERGS